MKLLVVFALALATASAAFVAPIVPVRDVQEESVFPKGRITNGKDAVEGQFPYQIFLSFSSSSGGLWCGGSLIGQNWVLTAAHCTSGTSSVRVYLGATVRSSPKVTYTVASDKFVQHESYNNKTNDISLIKIPAVTYSSAIRSIALPKIDTSYSNYIGQNAIVSGWGDISDDPTSPSPSKLQYATLPVIENSVCANYYQPGDITSSIICIATPDETSPCRGDSGGPLVFNDVLIGVASFVHRNGCTSGPPAGFTRVTSYLDWIKDKTGIGA